MPPASKYIPGAAIVDGATDEEWAAELRRLLGRDRTSTTKECILHGDGCRRDDRVFAGAMRVHAVPPRRDPNAMYAAIRTGRVALLRALVVRPYPELNPASRRMTARDCLGANNTAMLRVLIAEFLDLLMMLLQISERDEMLIAGIRCGADVSAVEYMLNESGAPLPPAGDLKAALRENARLAANRYACTKIAPGNQDAIVVALNYAAHLRRVTAEQPRTRLSALPPGVVEAHIWPHVDTYASLLSGGWRYG